MPEVGRIQAPTCEDLYRGEWCPSEADRSGVSRIGTVRSSDCRLRFGVERTGAGKMGLAKPLADRAHALCHSFAGWEYRLCRGRPGRHPQDPGQRRHLVPAIQRDGRKVAWGPFPRCPHGLCRWGRGRHPQDQDRRRREFPDIPGRRHVRMVQKGPGSLISIQSALDHSGPCPLSSPPSACHGASRRCPVTRSIVFRNRCYPAVGFDSMCQTDIPYGFGVELVAK